MTDPCDLPIEDLQIESLGPCEIESPLSCHSAGPQQVEHFVDDRDRVVFETRMLELEPLIAAGKPLPSVEKAGPRRKIFWNSRDISIAVVTCGGLCPGLNNVVRAITLEAHFRYGVRTIYGVRYGYQGFVSEYGHEPFMLTPKSVADIHMHGGTVLSSSRGRQDNGKMVDWLVAKDVKILIVIGGDGSQRGLLDIRTEIAKRGLKISVVGVPKTIDNDMVFLDKSFGFETAFSRAVEAISCAHAEAKGAPNGIGLVKLMGRHSGFIAAHAALARNDVNYVLIPEVPFDLEGPDGFLTALEKRLAISDHAVVVVAEGAGQEHLKLSGTFDASGNAKLADIGLFLRERITSHFATRGIEANLKYIDPSYMIRSAPADPQDALYCSRLGQNAVHAAMAGKTGLVVGRSNYRYVHLPAELVTSHRRHIDPKSDFWQSVLATTGQPTSMIN